MSVLPVLPVLVAQATTPSGLLAAALDTGDGHDRFDFTLALMIDGLAHR